MKDNTLTTLTSFTPITEKIIYKGFEETCYGNELRFVKRNFIITYTRNHVAEQVPCYNFE